MKKKLFTHTILFFSFAGLVVIVTALVLVTELVSFTNNNPSSAQETSPDAIAIRVIKNPNNYSALRWYKEQGFTGSPQSTTVDGYAAVRDGRTVYVNAANIAAGVLYPNIYLISYNQAAAQDTLDIFGRILSHWKFNTNITTPGACSESSTMVCLYDTECPSDEYCRSQKAQIIRDTERLAALAEIKLALENFREQRGHYPKLAAGSYLPSKTLSTWPSWQNILAQELALQLPLDPINRLGDCAANYHPITCWDEVSKSFSDADLTDPDINLPANSYAMVYSAEANGAGYDLCAVMESGYVSGTTAGACAGSNVIASSGSVANRAPLFVNVNFPEGYTGHEYNAYLEAMDPDGDTLTWSFDISPAGQWASWSAAPLMSDTAAVNQKHFKATSAGLAGVYSLAVTIDDGRGAANSSLTQVFPISITNLPPVITLGDYVYHASSTNPMSYQLLASDATANYPLIHALTGPLPLGWSQSFALVGTVYELNISGTIGEPVPLSTNFPYSISVTDSSGAVRTESFVISVINKAPIVQAHDRSVMVGSNELVTNPIVITVKDPENNNVTGSIIGTLPPGVGPLVKVSNNRFEIRGTPNGSTPVATPFPITVSIRDEYDAVTNENFVITITNTRPQVSVRPCSSAIRRNDPFTCVATATDPDGHAIVNYLLTPGTYPSGLFINASGQIAGSPTEAGIFNIEISAIDQYDAVSTGVIKYLAVNSFCGDNMKQYPNSEGRGGPLDLGREECDGLDGVASSPSDSSSDKQYECTTPPLCATTGSCAGSCTHTGGYCGDNILQAAHGEQCEAAGNGTSVTNQYECNDCAWGGGWCGDTSVQAPYGEACEFGGGGTGFNDQWQCTSNCQWTGGWCGDAMHQPAFEQCDPSIVSVAQQCAILRDAGVRDLDGGVLDCNMASNNAWSSAGVSFLYKNICQADCSIACIGSSEFVNLGVGCYLDTNSFSGIQDDECQKGRMMCVDGAMTCYDTFTDPNFTFDYSYSGGQPVFDECCTLFNDGTPPDFSSVMVVYPGSDYSCSWDGCDGYTNTGNNNPNYLQGSASSLGWVDLVFHSVIPAYSYQYVYNCDQVCKMRGNRICIGVGLSNTTNPATYCKYVQCDSGPTCNSGGNLANTTCKTDFYYWDSHSCWDGSRVFPVKSTACYCY